MRPYPALQVTEIIDHKWQAGGIPTVHVIILFSLSTVVVI
jgi:hypothetical protein